jgi:3-phenylpropionate/trans-cinnamate dioxygenase ferredoxin reductase component
MSATSTFVIIGAGMAGALTAQALREEGFDGRLVLVGDEVDRPYERPPLSKGYLMGTAERDDMFVHAKDWYAEHDVELRQGVQATGLDIGRHEVTLGSDEQLRYDALGLATGAVPRQLRVPGADLTGVHYLRRVGDSEQLREAFGTSTRAVVIGGGWIGLETAAAARAAGVAVTLLERSELPLQGILGSKLAQVFAGLHRHNGVDLRVQTEVAEILGDNGKVTGVRLTNGDHVPADLVIVGVGVLPNIALAERAGLNVDNGVVVDEHLRTSDADIVAVGDIANAYHPLLKRHLRVEHWANARRQPPIAAQTMLGRPGIYDRMPYFFSDQYNLGMEYAGFVEPGGYDDVVLRGDVDRLEFLAFWVSDRRVLAGMNVNVWDVNPDIDRLVVSGRQVDRDQLADPDVPLDSL